MSSSHMRNIRTRVRVAARRVIGRSDQSVESSRYIQSIEYYANQIQTHCTPELSDLLANGGVVTADTFRQMRDCDPNSDCFAVYAAVLISRQPGGEDYVYVGSASGTGLHREDSWGLRGRIQQHLSKIAGDASNKSLFYNTARGLKQTHILIFRPLVIIARDIHNLSDDQIIRAKADARALESIVTDMLAGWHSSSTGSAKSLYDAPNTTFAKAYKSLARRNPLAEECDYRVSSTFRLTHAQYLQWVRQQNLQLPEHVRSERRDRIQQMRHQDDNWHRIQQGNRQGNERYRLSIHQDPEKRRRHNDKEAASERRRVAARSPEEQAAYTAHRKMIKVRSDRKIQAELDEIRLRPGNRWKKVKELKAIRSAEVKVAAAKALEERMRNVDM